MAGMRTAAVLVAKQLTQSLLSGSPDQPAWMALPTYSNGEDVPLEGSNDPAMTMQVSA